MRIGPTLEAVKAGAFDYLSKPLDFDRLRKLLVDARDGIHRRERMMEVDAEVARQFEFHGMIGRSPAMQELFDSIRRLAPHVRTVLISGETGTGKELVAQALHRAGPRQARRFITLDCFAVVESLFESEFFGHVRGAFTGASETKVGMFEHSDGGTLFLDEAGELPLSLQAKLLRAVEYGEVQRVGSLAQSFRDRPPGAGRSERSAADEGPLRAEAVVHRPVDPDRQRRRDAEGVTGRVHRHRCGGGRRGRGGHRRRVLAVGCAVPRPATGRRQPRRRGGPRPRHEPTVGIRR